MFINEILAKTFDLKIHDIIIKTIGIKFANVKLCLIFEVGNVLLIKNKSLKYFRDFNFGGKNQISIVIKIYEGNDEVAKNNTFLGKFTLEYDKKQKV